jgi:hypothetical protein
MCGEKMAYAEETELLRRIALSEPEVIFYFDPELYVYHHVPSSKMKIRWIIKSALSFGRSSHIMYLESKTIKPQNKKLLNVYLQIILKFIVIFRIALQGFFVRNKNKYRYIKNYWWEELYAPVKVLGRLFEEYRYIKNCFR